MVETVVVKWHRREVGELTEDDRPFAVAAYLLYSPTSTATVLFASERSRIVVRKRKQPKRIFLALTVVFE